MENIPLATYRVQLRPGFGFADLAEVLDYLAELGISHVYSSPILQAVAGSTHGYDVVDPTLVNAELGGEEAFTRACQELRRRGLGLVLDIVPNHVAIGGRANPWWWDVLENGPSSRYASFFDVGWDPGGPGVRNKVLLPVLGDRYARVLEANEIRLEREGGCFRIRYHEHIFPAAPGCLRTILAPAVERCGSAKLAFLADAFGDLPPAASTDPGNTARRHRDKEILRALLARLCGENTEAAVAVDAVVAETNADPEALDRVLGQQNYRLAFWRVSSSELGYRRFFDITHLAGLRIEDDRVFAETHTLVLRWLLRGVLAGVRIDHIDGLLDPAQYLRRLRKAAPEAWIVVEKILGPEERLPQAWPVAGTTGYDFLNLVNSLLVDPDGEGPLTTFYAEFTGRPVDYAALVREKKHQVLREVLGGELNRLVAMLAQICERHRRSRDYTREDLDATLRELVACFPVYRSYVCPGPDGVGESDIRYVSESVESARRSRPELDPDLLEFVRELLLLRIDGNMERELALRFQQLTGPAMAKGVEDTAFYCFNRLVSLNEVGGDPGRFGRGVEEFHRACQEMQTRRPHGMLATSTHDTKRSEDVRARINLLPEIPEHWRAAVLRWSTINARHRIGDSPDRNAEYLLYQTLVGAWPIETDRVAAYMEKAAREAKMFTSWLRPNPDYEAALKRFVNGVLTDEEFTADLRRFVEPLEVSAAVNSLAQTLLKLTAPGVPDIYQGTELWDFSLVDPDNRRPVSYTLRQRLLGELKAATPEGIWDRVQEGLPKMYVIRQALALRRAHPEWFGEAGDYRPLVPTGRKSGHVVAFVRGENAIAVVPRFPLRLGGKWADTALALPSGRWRNEFTGDPAVGTMQIADLLRRFPVALLSREKAGEQ